MPDALHSKTPLPNPLHDLHTQAEAEFQLYAQTEIVSTFGQPEAEYAALRKGCGLIDLPQRGFLELSGKDRLPFLNNLLTNQTWDKQAKSGLAAGAGVYAFLLELKGRIVTDMTVLELGDRTLLEMDGRYVGVVRTTFEKYLFAEQVKLTERIGALHELALHGPGALSVLQRAVDDGALLGALQPISCAMTNVFGVETVIWRDDPTAAPGYHLIVPASSVIDVWTNLLNRFGAARELGKRELRGVGWAAYNAARIEGGRPVFGVDFDDSVLPAETGQFDRAVSVTKGCYLGQEIVARMHARQQVARQLVGLRMDGDALPYAGTRIYDDKDHANEIGGVTSSTLSPVLSNISICLGYLKRPYFAPGTVVVVPAEGAMHQATVVPTPFVGAERS